jgi:hypothetical protein
MLSCRWANRESSLKEMPGFLNFNMLRRDADKPDDGYNFVSATVRSRSLADDSNIKLCALIGRMLNIRRDCKLKVCSSCTYMVYTLTDTPRMGG